MAMSKGYAGAAAEYVRYRQLEIDCKRAYAAGYDWGQAEPNRTSEPLSGEWAGESIPELSRAYGLDLHDSDIADSFEAGFYAGQEEGK